MSKKKLNKDDFLIFFIKLMCFAMALALVVAFSIPLFKDGRKFSQKQLFPSESNLEPIPMQSLDLGDGSFQESLSFEIFGENSPNQIESLDLLFGTYSSSPELLSAKILSKSQNCTLKADENQLIEDNRLLRFNPEDLCDVKHGDRLELIVRIKGQSNLAIFGVRPKNSANLPVIVRNDKDEILFPFGYLSASFDKKVASVNRLKLISSMWDKSSNVDGWIENKLFIIISIFALAIVLLLMSLFFSKFEFIPCLVSIGTGLIFASIGFYYATITPPFEAPDEATHFLTYLGKSNLNDQALLLAQKGDYSRIMCRTDQVYTIQDMNSDPGRERWPGHVNRTIMESRSALGSQLWKLYRYFDFENNAADRLWRLRVSNVIFLSLLLSIALFFSFPSHTRENFLLRSAVSAAVFLPATLPNFGMHLSNHPLTLAGYLILLIVMPSIVFIGANIFKSSLSGLGLALIIFSGRTGVIGATCLLWLFVNISIFEISMKARNGKNVDLRKYLLNFAFFLFPLLLATLSFADSAYSSQIILSLTQNARDLFANHSRIALMITFVFGFLMVFPIAINKASKSRPIFLSQVTNLCGIFLTLILMCLLVLPKFHFFKPIPEIEYQQWNHSVVDFVKITFKSFLGNIGFGGRDFFLFWSFWGGFGCPDRTFPDYIIQIFKVITVLGWLAYSVSLIFSRKIKHLVFLFYAGIAGSLWLFLLSYSAGTLSINLHGRFTLGFHLLTILLSMLGFLFLTQELTENRIKYSNQFLFAASLFFLISIVFGSQSTAVWWSLYRFFG